VITKTQVSSDGACETKACHTTIAARDVNAVIPVRKNCRLWKENIPPAQASNEILRETQRLGRTIWKKWNIYHLRSLVENKMRCFKLLGDSVMARRFNRQVVELQIRAALLNRITRLGTSTMVAIT
jgi:hypothetical protein